MTKENYPSLLEWESFDFPITVDNVTSGRKFYRIPESSRVTIARDNQYKLVGSMEGFTEDHQAFEYREEGRELTDGSIIKGDTLIGETSPLGQIYHLHHCYITNARFGQLFQGRPSTRFEATLDFSSFVETLTDKPAAKKCVGI